jgi:hypothetical protein
VPLEDEDVASKTRVRSHSCILCNTQTCTHFCVLFALVAKADGGDSAEFTYDRVETKDGDTRAARCVYLI